MLVRLLHSFNTVLCGIHLNYLVLWGTLIPPLEDALKIRLSPLQFNQDTTHLVPASYIKKCINYPEIRKPPYLIRTLKAGARVFLTAPRVSRTDSLNCIYLRCMTAE